MEVQNSQGVQRPRHKQSQQPPVQPSYVTGYYICPWTTQQTLSGPRTESPRAGTSTHRGSSDKQSDETGTAITAIAQSMLTGPPASLSSAHLTSEQVAKWVQHLRTQLEARTFDSRTLTTTISEKAWKMIGFKIASSRQPFQRLERIVEHEHVP